MKRIPKKYGETKTTPCPFCGENAFFPNTVGLSVCAKHKDTSYPHLKCRCGSILEIKTGKFGTYAFCFSCGNMPLAKVLAHNGVL